MELDKLREINIQIKTNNDILEVLNPETEEYKIFYEETERIINSI
jgi:hypothetical protein